MQNVKCMSFWAIKSSLATIRNWCDQKTAPGIHLKKSEVIHVIWIHYKSASLVEIHHGIVWWRDGVCTEAGDITSRQPWFWGTAVHCGLHWLERRLCSEQSRGTPWLAVWTAPLDTGTGRSDCAPLKQEKTSKRFLLTSDFVLFASAAEISNVITMKYISTITAALEMFKDIISDEDDASHPPPQYISVRYDLHYKSD